MKEIEVGSYAIFFGDSAYQKLRYRLHTSGYSKVFIAVDENTQSLCLPYFLDRTDLSGCEIIPTQSGEENKTLGACIQVWQMLTRMAADRKSLLLNLGGGVLTDIGGFAATAFKRGIDFIHIPTTLLNMVDASIGGKTGVNLGVLKNQIGVFSNPKMVLIDSRYLQTLPDREYRSGLAEMIKYGLSLDGALYCELQAHQQFTAERRDSLIRRCAQLKTSVVRKDFRERGLRKVLNVGHSIGHAVEARFLERKEKLLHGEAIAVGLIAEAYLSYKLNYLEERELVQVSGFIRSIYPKVQFEKKDFQSIKSQLKHDKKSLRGALNFSLIRGIGGYALDVHVPESLIGESLDYYQSL
ncbi:MAG: 3-dehydroquinate synthase [Flavobacteriales bacterium]